VRSQRINSGNVQTSRCSNRTKLARALRERVFVLLGGKCAVCASLHNLEVDVIVSACEPHHDLGNLRRWQFYLRKALAGQAQLLCVLHHREKSRRDLLLRRQRASAAALLAATATSG